MSFICNELALEINYEDTNLVAFESHKNSKRWKEYLFMHGLRGYRQSVESKPCLARLGQHK